MLFYRTIKSSAALLLLTVGFAAPVHAQNNKQIISGTWYEDRASILSASNGLTLAFAQTPTDQFLNVTNISCFVSVLSTQVIASMTLQAGTSSGASDLGRPYNLRGGATAETQGSDRYFSIVQNGMFYKFGPGRYPTVIISAPSTGSTLIDADCVIVGNLTDN